MAEGRRPDPLRGMRYTLEIDGITKAKFSEATIPDTTQDPIDYREGDEVPTVRKVPGLNKYGNITLKQGTTGDSIELWKWRNMVELGKHDDARKTVTINILDPLGKTAATWVMINAWPTKYDAPDLKADGNDIAIESMEICCEGMERTK